MHRITWTYTQSADNPQVTWVLDNVPEGAKGPFVTHIQDSNGTVHVPIHQEPNSDGHIEISFGMNALSGTAYGSYYLEHLPDDHHTHDDEDDSGGDSDVVVETEDHTIRSAGKVVNITVNQYDHGGLESQS